MHSFSSHELGYVGPLVNPYTLAFPPLRPAGFSWYYDYIKSLGAYNATKMGELEKFASFGSEVTLEYSPDPLLDRSSGSFVIIYQVEEPPFVRAW